MFPLFYEKTECKTFPKLKSRKKRVDSVKKLKKKTKFMLFITHFTTTPRTSDVRHSCNE